MMYLDYTNFINLVDVANLQLLFSENNNSYTLFGIGSSFSIACLLVKDNDVDHLDFEANWKYKANNPIAPTVTTQFELDNKDLKLARCKGSVDINSKEAVASLKVPGQFGVDDGRWIAGGYATIENFDPDDYVTVYFEDTDRIIGWAIAQSLDPEAVAPLDDATIQQMGKLPSPFNQAFPDYPVVKSYTDDEVDAQNQGWYLDPLIQGNNLPALGYTDVEPIAGYGHAIAGMYLKIKLQRANLSSGTFRVSVWWGKKE